MLYCRIPALTISYSSRKKRESQNSFRDDSHFTGFDTDFDDEFFKNESSKPEHRRQEDFDPSVMASESLYCSIVNALDKTCFENSLLELWQYDTDKIKNLTKADILRTLNVTTIRY